MGSLQHKGTDRASSALLLQGLDVYRQLGKSGLQTLATQYSQDALGAYALLGEQGCRATALHNGVTAKAYDKIKAKGTHRLACAYLGSLKTAKQLWFGYLNILYGYWQKHYWGYVDGEDVIQLSYLAVRKALECYDPSKGFSFASYLLTTWSSFLRHEIRTHQVVKCPPEAGSWDRFLLQHHGNKSLDWGRGDALESITDWDDLEYALESCEVANDC